MILLGLHGKAGAGKDTLADRLVHAHGFSKRGFADPLYEEVARAWRVDVAWLRDRARKEVPQEELRLLYCLDRGFYQWARAECHDDTIKRSPRWVLERWGTEYRRGQSKTYWVDQMAAYVNARIAAGARGLAIPDVRFPDEAVWLRAHGGRVVEIVRPGIADVSSHVSAQRLPDALVDEQVRNESSLSYLHGVADSLTCCAMTNAAT